MSQERNRLGNFAKDCADPQHYKLRLVRSRLMTPASAQRGLHRITMQIASTGHLRFNTRREIVVIAKFKIVVSAIIVSFSYAARCSLNRSIVLKALATSCPPIMTAAAACILASRHRTHAVFMRSRGLGALFPDHLR